MGLLEGREGKVNNAIKCLLLPVSKEILCQQRKKEQRTCIAGCEVVVKNSETFESQKGGILIKGVPSLRR